MKRILFNLLPAIFLWFGSCCIATAQAPVAQSDQITDDQQIIQDDSSSTGKFEPVAVDPSASSDVALQFPLSLASKPVVVQPLDGGVLQIGNSVIDQNGLLSFSFQVTDQPGVHRVIVIDPNADEDSTHIIGMVQFEVPNPAE
jgi:hypothetical protein